MPRIKATILPRICFLKFFFFTKRNSICLKVPTCSLFSISSWKLIAACSWNPFYLWNTVQLCADFEVENKAYRFKIRLHAQSLGSLDSLAVFDFFLHCTKSISCNCHDSKYGERIFTFINTHIWVGTKCDIRIVAL